jgi:hypothetical protein
VALRHLANGRKDGEGGSGKAAFLPHLKKKVTQVKQYLVVKMIASLNYAAELIPLPGLYTLGAAQEFILKARASEPEAKYVIQEVGAA